MFAGSARLRLSGRHGNANDLFESGYRIVAHGGRHIPRRIMAQLRAICLGVIGRGGGRAVTYILPSPLAGEGGPQSGSDEGSTSAAQRLAECPLKPKAIGPRHRHSDIAVP